MLIMFEIANFCVPIIFSRQMKSFKFGISSGFSDMRFAAEQLSIALLQSRTQSRTDPGY